MVKVRNYFITVSLAESDESLNSVVAVGVEMKAHGGCVDGTYRA